MSFKEVLEKEAEFLSKNIVNQLFDKAEVSVKKRQSINDLCDEFVKKLIMGFVCPSEPETTNFFLYLNDLTGPYFSENEKKEILAFFIESRAYTYLSQASKEAPASGLKEIVEDIDKVRIIALKHKRDDIEQALYEITNKIFKVMDKAKEVEAPVEKDLEASDNQRMQNLINELIIIRSATHTQNDYRAFTIAIEKAKEYLHQF